MLVFKGGADMMRIIQDLKVLMKLPVEGDNSIEDLQFYRINTSILPITFSILGYGA